MKPRSLGLVAIAVLALASGTVSLAQTAPAPALTPPPPPQPNVNATLGPIFGTPGPTPLPSTAPVPTSPASDAPRKGKKGAAVPAASSPAPSATATDTPEPPQFQSMDGVWEVQMQPLDGTRTKYSHLYVTQKGNDLTGTWKKDDNKTSVPFTGTFDGRLFKLNLSDATKTLTFSGYAENFSDMVGIWSDGDPKHDGVPFTASHRKRERLAH
ncbi:MAG: hypothetical protein NVSMB64_22130 [Candidatus Velthaea sp.]